MRLFVFANVHRRLSHGVLGKSIVGVHSVNEPDVASPYLYEIARDERRRKESVVPRRARHIKQECRDRDAPTRRTGRRVSMLRKRPAEEEEEDRRRREAPLPSGVPPRAFIPSCTVPVKPALFELSQWRNKTSTGGSNSTPKPKRSLLPFPSAAEAPPPFSLPPYPPCSPTHHCYPTVSSPGPPSCTRSANNKTTPERGTTAWRAFRPFLSFSLLSLAISFPANPFPGSRTLHLFRHCSR